MADDCYVCAHLACSSIRLESKGNCSSRPPNAVGPGALISVGTSSCRSLSANPTSCDSGEAMSWIRRVRVAEVVSNPANNAKITWDISRHMRNCDKTTPAVEEIGGQRRGESRAGGRLTISHKYPDAVNTSNLGSDNSGYSNVRK